MEHPPDLQTYRIIGAAQSVHRRLGPNFPEKVYQEALEKELQACGIPARREVPLAMHYADTRLAAGFRVDFLCFDSVVVEIKAHPRLAPTELRQVLGYLRASRLRVGLLLNFGLGSLGIRRFINGYD